MSFFPLNEVQCGPLKPRKYPKVVIGSINAPFGYRIDERSDCIVVPVPKSFEHFEKEKQREHEQLMKILDFEKETNRKIRRKKVWQRVQQGTPRSKLRPLPADYPVTDTEDRTPRAACKGARSPQSLTEYQDEVDERRERLRELLLREQMSLTREVVDQAQHGDDARMDEMRARSEQLRKQQEEQRLAVVAAKRMQQYLAQCPEFRKKMLKKSSIDAKMVNLSQMADNEAKKRAEKELDSLWHELMLKEVEMKKEREIEEVKNRCLIEQANVTTLAKQIAGKLALEEQRKEVTKEDGEYIEQMLKKLQEEDAKKQEEKRQKREKLKKELQDQILIAKRQLAERARQEAEIDRLRQTLAEEELAKERSKIKESSAALRNELLSYLQYLEELRKEEARRNIELDRIVEQWTRDAAAKRDLAKKKSKEAKEKSLQEMIRSLDEQLEIKCHREKQEMEERRLEKEALEKEIELNAKLAAHAKEEAKNKMLRYAKELEDQWTQIGEARRRERAEEIERMRLEELKQQEEYEMLTEELLNASENITPHPFKILLKQCAARYAAEKEGHCYCPPPLPEE